MSNLKQFKQFLEANDIDLDLFNSRVEQVGGVKKNIDEIASVINEPSLYLAASFPWTYAPEGFQYWDELDSLWEKEIGDE